MWITLRWAAGTGNHTRLHVNLTCFGLPKNLGVTRLIQERRSGEIGGRRERGKEFCLIWQILAIIVRSGRYDTSEMKLATVFALIVLGVQAQTLDARLDALVAPYRENDAPGMFAILIHDGRIVWQTAFGFADVEAHRTITPIRSSNSRP